MHLPIDPQAIIFRQIDWLIRDYDRVFTEMALSETNDAYLNQHIWVDYNEWKRHWSNHQMERLSVSLKKYTGIDITRHIGLRPLFFISLIYRKMIDAIGTGVPVDQYIWNQGESYGKVTDGLETVEEQVRTLRALSIDEEYKQLRKMILNLSKARKKLRQMVELYDRQDIGAIYRLTRRSLGAHRHILLYERNRRMANRIDTYHRQAKSVFSFGAGHLSGQNGILRLLKQKGYIVKPIKSEDAKSEN